MSPRPRLAGLPSTLLSTGAGVLVLAVLVLTHSLAAHAAGPAATAAKSAPKTAAEDGVRWQDLKPSQQAVLKPLQRDWAGIDALRKQKWLELSARFPRMTPNEQSRVQARMADWAKLTPRERGEARLNYEEAKQLPVQDRQARWESYQALSPEQKRQLAARARPAPGAPRAVASAEAPQAKSNIVPNPAFAVPRKQVAPTVTRAGPGATTTLMSRRPTPPSHQQTGLPKIAATPEFVNKATLQPKRGPQAAATRSAKNSEAEPARRQ
ncbi:MAG: DUF3106 domain-containing protein [Burkholderiales bacterium]